MKNPKIGKPYTFVRQCGDTFEHTDFVRHEDGSAGFEGDGYFAVFECHPDAWIEALASLSERGFFEFEEARQQLLIPIDWLPTAETSTAAIRGPVTVTELAAKEPNQTV